MAIDSHCHQRNKMILLQTSRFEIQFEMNFNLSMRNIVASDRMMFAVVLLD